MPVIKVRRDIISWNGMPVPVFFKGFYHYETTEENAEYWNLLSSEDKAELLYEAQHEQVDIRVLIGMKRLAKERRKVYPSRQGEEELPEQLPKETNNKQTTTKIDAFSEHLAYSHKNLQESYSEEIKSARDSKNVSIVMALIGLVMILMGAILTMLGNLQVSVYISVSSVISNSISILFFRRAENARKRINKHHDDLLNQERTIVMCSFGKSLCQTIEDPIRRDICLEYIVKQVIKHD